MAPLVIYGHEMSPYVRRVVVTLFEMGVEDFRLESVDPLKGETRTPQFLEKQPFGMIPLLDDDGELLSESRAIMRYIAEKYLDSSGSSSSSAPNLLGRDLLERTRVNQWIDLEGHSYHDKAHALGFELIMKGVLGMGEPDREKLASLLDVYDRHLEARAYLAGDSFTLADLTHLPMTELFPAMGIYDELIASRPNVKAWWERISSRLAWKKVQEKYPYKGGPEA